MVYHQLLPVRKPYYSLDILLLLFFFLFPAAPTAYGSSWFTAGTYATAVATLDPLPAAPQQELLDILLRPQKE